MPSGRFGGGGACAPFAPPPPLGSGTVTCRGPLLILYNHIIIRETGSKKALFFNHNETPKLSSSKVFLIIVNNKIYSATFFIRAILERYLQRKFKMLIMIIIIIIIKNKNRRAIKSNMNTY